MKNIVKLSETVKAAAPEGLSATPLERLIKVTTMPNLAKVSELTSKDVKAYTDMLFDEIAVQNRGGINRLHLMDGVIKLDYGSIRLTKIAILVMKHGIGVNEAARIIKDVE